jgi:hypothetical protein
MNGLRFVSTILWHGIGVVKHKSEEKLLVVKKVPFFLSLTDISLKFEHYPSPLKTSLYATVKLQTAPFAGKKRVPRSLELCGASPALTY